MSKEAHYIINLVGRRYLLLHRENYIEEASDVRSFLERLAETLLPSDVAQLLKDDDWRVELVGVHLAIVGRLAHLVPNLAAMLDDPRSRAVRRATMLALLTLNPSGAISILKAFTRSPIMPDALHEYAAAAEGLLIATKEDPHEVIVILEQLVREGHSVEDFKLSRVRFRTAVQFWS